MTRAKNWLCLSSYDNDNDKHPRGKSRFLDYIPQRLFERIKTLDSTPIPPRSEEMIVPQESFDYVEPLPEKLLQSNVTVIGIDPGNIGAKITNVGWSITQKSPDDYTVINYNTQILVGQKDDKLKQIERKINELIRLHLPDGIAVEKIEVGIEVTRKDWFLDVAGCVASIRSISDQHGIECHLYTPLQVKYAATGNRKASKEDVQKAVKRVCNLPEIPEPHHSADAIAASLCYLRSYLNSSRFEGNKRKQERYKVGCDYLNKRQYEAAIYEFKEAINIDPIYTKTYCGLGLAYLEQVKLVEAENSAKEALRLEHDYPLALQILESIKQKHCELGRDYFNQDDLAAAENSAKEALRLDSSFQPVLDLLEDIKQAYYNRGLNYLSNLQYNEAIAAFEENNKQIPKIYNSVLWTWSSSP